MTIFTFNMDDDLFEELVSINRYMNENVEDGTLETLDETINHYIYYGNVYLTENREKVE